MAATSACWPFSISDFTNPEFCLLNSIPAAIKPSKDNNPGSS